MPGDARRPEKCYFRGAEDDPINVAQCLHPEHWKDHRKQKEKVDYKIKIW